jgi:hypothetical protein
MVFKDVFYGMLNMGKASSRFSFSGLPRVIGWHILFFVIVSNSFSRYVA